MWLILFVISLTFALFHKNIVAFMPVTVAKLYGVTLVPYCWMFLFGAFLSEKKDVCLEFLQKYWWTFLIVAFFIRYFNFDFRVVLYGLFYSIFSFFGFIGFAYRFPNLNLKNDVSYAVYVYHMVIVNAFIALGLTHKVWNLLAVIALTFVIGYVSTVTVGAIGMKKKNKLSKI